MKAPWKEANVTGSKGRAAFCGEAGPVTFHHPSASFFIAATSSEIVAQSSITIDYVVSEPVIHEPDGV